MRRLILSCLGCLALTLLVAPPAFAKSAEICNLNTTAHFTPGLSTSLQAFTYNFSGELNECSSPGEKSSFGGSGNFEAGLTVETFVENSTTHELDWRAYAMPVPTGSGSCAASTTSGSALAEWPDGTRTVVSYSTTGSTMGASTTGSVLSGEVVPSMTLQAVNAEPGDPTTLTYTTNRFVGYTLHGTVEVQPTPLTACTTSTGATAAALHGTVVFISP